MALLELIGVLSITLELDIRTAILKKRIVISATVDFGVWFYTISRQEFRL
jgi:hypothetical protein